MPLGQSASVGRRLKRFARRRLRRWLTGSSDLVLTDQTPDIGKAFEGIDELGLYLHLPFCRQICPYCPYNKTLYQSGLADDYAEALIHEIDLYAPVIGQRTITSFYIGGGTPTVMLDHGLSRILEHFRRTLRVRCDIHMESHPLDLTDVSLDSIQAMGVRHLSIGIESLQDKHLRALGRPYDANLARHAVARAVGRGFECVNADMMFALPDQSVDDAVDTARALIHLGVDQIAAYPIFDFPYTPRARAHRAPFGGPNAILRRRKMLTALEQVFRNAGFTRTSVWAFTREGVPHYCSVTVPLYLGLGAGGGSYLRDVFYLNTFDARAYSESLAQGRLPIALSVPLSVKMQMAGWLYWRAYGVRFAKRDFLARFGMPFDTVYGHITRGLVALDLARDDGAQVALTDAGAYWLHVLQDLFSLDAVGTLWGAAMAEPWPRRVTL